MCIHRSSELLCLCPSVSAHIRTPVPRHTCPCARTPACSSLSSPSCCWRGSPSWALQGTCATCGKRCRRIRVRRRPGSTSSSKSLSVSRWAGLCRPTFGCTWWRGSNRQPLSPCSHGCNCLCLSLYSDIFLLPFSEWCLGWCWRVSRCYLKKLFIIGLVSPHNNLKWTYKFFATPKFALCVFARKIVSCSKIFFWLIVGV